MKALLPFVSIRWKIIFFSGLVLGLTSIWFIWQQHKLQLREFELHQSEFHERTHVMLEHLYESQAERMQMLSNLLLEQANVRENILKKRGTKLTDTIDALSSELNLGQGVISVVFHDAEQNVLAVWGEPTDLTSLIRYAKVTLAREQPKSQLVCKQTCLYQITLPISYQGNTIATVTLISNLEYFLNDLHRLANADVAVFSGDSPDHRAPIATLRIVSASGGPAIREILDVARTGTWLNDRFQYEHNGQTHQLVRTTIPQLDDEKISFVLISDVTNESQLIDYQSKKLIYRGLLIFALALLLLYVVLRPMMQRIQHVSHMLPLLGEEKFVQIREGYASLSRVKRLRVQWKDEVDELDSLALALVNRLEKLRDEANLHNKVIAANALELKLERDFIFGLLNTAPVLILSYSLDGKIQLANNYSQQICAVTGLVGQNYAGLFLGVSQTDYVLELREMKAGEVHRTESRITTANGTVSDILWHCSRLAVAANEAPSYLSVGMDITEHKKNEARIHNLAFYEPLTKLPNRRMLSDCVRHAMKSSARDHTHCALLFIDIDHFKAINDSKGQDVGDCLLVEIAKRLRLSLREFDTVAHLGGDEFVVLLEGLDQEVEQAVKQARSITENLRAKISLSCLVQELTYHLTSSVGVSLFRGDGEAGDEVFRHANIAMSHAKTSGRNTLRFFDPAMQISLEDRAELEADLYHALEDRQFELYYQVQTNSAGRAEGAEALIRWLHPQRGMVSPLNFIPIAEESDLMLSIGLWVLETACAQIKAWDANALSRDLQLAVNVSARQFQQPDFVTLVLRTLELSGANPDRLKLELTESLVLNDISDAVSKMQQLKKHGVRFSIDDFGTAYSSLSYLTQLPMDQLKIDQSFVRNIGVKPGDAIIVQTIIGMAKNLGMEVIAEGVETLAQLEFLGLAGCQNYQGYLFSKPLPLAAFNAYLATTQG